MQRIASLLLQQRAETRAINHPVMFVGRVRRFSRRDSTVSICIDRSHASRYRACLWRANLEFQGRAGTCAASVSGACCSPHRSPLQFPSVLLAGFSHRASRRGGADKNKNCARHRRSIGSMPVANVMDRPPFHREFFVLFDDKEEDAAFRGFSHRRMAVVHAFPNASVYSPNTTVCFYCATALQIYDCVHRFSALTLRSNYF